MAEGMMQAIRAVVSPLARRVSQMVSRGLVKIIGDSDSYQRLQVEILSDEVKDGVERMQNYGFTSVPLKGAEALVLFVGADRGHPVIVVVDDGRNRKRGMEEGEVALYTDEGDYVLLKRGREIEVRTNKISITNENHELVAVLSEFAQAVIDARVITSLGPQPLVNPTNPFSTIKAKLDSFKV